MLVEFECPKCNGHMCERWSLNGSNLGIRLMYWHMILNPGLAFNELVLGQRTPQEMYFCQSCTLPMLDRGYVHCPACSVFHPGRIWSYKNAFGHWLGLVCPTCGAEIPCLWNLTSRLVLAVTAPIWYMPVKHNKAKLLGQQHKRIAQSSTNYIDKTTEAPKPVNYKLMGLLFGVFMFAFFTLLFPPIFLVLIGRFSLTGIITIMTWAGLSGLVLCPIGGLFFMFSMQRMLDKKGDQALHITFDSHGAVISANAPAQVDVPSTKDNS
jgi:hypothetical protein